MNSQALGLGLGLGSTVLSSGDTSTGRFSPVTPVMIYGMPQGTDRGVAPAHTVAVTQSLAQSLALTLPWRQELMGWCTALGSTRMARPHSEPKLQP